MLAELKSIYNRGRTTLTVVGRVLVRALVKVRLRTKRTVVILREQEIHTPFEWQGRSRNIRRDAQKQEDGAGSAQITFETGVNAERSEQAVRRTRLGVQFSCFVACAGNNPLCQACRVDPVSFAHCVRLAATASSGPTRTTDFSKALVR